MQALSWLAGCLHRQGSCLVAGDFVLLGSLVQTVWVERGDHVAVSIEGMGEVSLSFA